MTPSLRHARRALAAAALAITILTAIACGAPRDTATSGSARSAAPEAAPFGLQVDGAEPSGSLRGKPGWDCPVPSCDWASGATPPMADTLAAEAAPPTTASYRGDGPAGADATSTMAAVLDDNRAWDAYVRYQQDFHRAHPGSGLRPPVLEPPTSFRVVTSSGQPVLGASVEVVDPSGRTLGSAATHADGTALLQVPSLPGAFTVNVRRDLAMATATFASSAGEVSVTLDALTGAEAPRVDVLFLVDVTSSMADDVERLKADVASFTARIATMAPAPSARFALTVYRDEGEAFVTRTFNFTSDASEFAAALGEVTVGGGGDTPEALDQGLADAIAKPDWGGFGTIKLIFLVADAPPRLVSGTSPPYDLSLAAAVVTGISIHPVGVAGLDDTGEYLFRHLAQATGGRFVFATSPDAQAGGLPPAHLASRDGYRAGPLGEVLASVVADAVRALTVGGTG